MSEHRSGPHSNTRIAWGVGLLGALLIAAVFQWAVDPQPVSGSTIPATPPPTTPAVTPVGTTTSPPTPGSTIPATPQPTPTASPTPDLPPSPESIPQDLVERYNVPTIITTEPVWVPDEGDGGTWITEWEVTARSRVEAVPGGWLAIEYADSWPTYRSYVGDNAQGEPVSIDVPYPFGLDFGIRSVPLLGVADSTAGDMRIFVLPRDAMPLTATMRLTFFPVSQEILPVTQLVGVQYDWYDGSISTVAMEPVQVGAYGGRAQNASVRSDGTQDGILDLSVATVAREAMTADAAVLSEVSLTGISGSTYRAVETDWGTLYLIANEGVERGAADLRILQDSAGDLFLELRSLEGAERLFVKLDQGASSAGIDQEQERTTVNPEDLPNLILFVLNGSGTILPVTGGLTEGVYYAAPPQLLRTNQLTLPIIR